MTNTLVLLRHGESEWNRQNLFTGWYDCDLSPTGDDQAIEAGRLLAEHDIQPDVVHTSVQLRAIRTAELALWEMGRSWLPVRRSWRLNERHYGALQGLDKKATAQRYGAEQVRIWRRSYDVPPPPLDPDDEHNARHDPRYANLPPELIPDTECLKDVVERMLPYWYDAIIPDLLVEPVVLVSAHGNSLRALVKYLDGISDEDIPELNIPTGEPLVYELDDDFHPAEDIPIEERYLSSPEEIQAKAEAVARQAGV
jgi:2,3-bisphosphoglycerate-dependent phosphoglycerate mutase